MGREKGKVRGEGSEEGKGRDCPLSEILNTPLQESPTHNDRRCSEEG